jgi:hypothetical protein
VRETEVVRGVGVAEIKIDASKEDKNSEIALVPADTNRKLPSVVGDITEFVSNSKKGTT